MQTDNQSPQLLSPEQQLPSLNLSQPQIAVLSAHLADAMAHMIAIEFSGSADQRLNLQSLHTFHQGRKTAIQNILTHDQDAEQAAIQAREQQ